MERAVTLGSRRIAVPVAGGDLAVRVWGDLDAPDTVIAAHGITSHALAWAEVAARLDGVCVVAPDLRGRAGSRDLPGPFGLRAHAADLVATLDALAVERALVLGHSMGAFVAVLAAATLGSRARAVLLVDGGVPLELPDGASVADYATRLLGPALARLGLEFESTEEYRAYWRAHPAMAEWTPTLDAYVDADLVGAAPRLRPSSVLAAVEADTLDEFGPDWYLEAARAIRVPVTALTAPRGLLDADPLYPPGRVAAFRAEIPQLRIDEVPDCNHYSIVLGRGSGRVADAVRELLAATELPST